MKVRKPVQIEIRCRVVKRGVKVTAKARHVRWFRDRTFYFNSTSGPVLNLGWGDAFVPLPADYCDRCTITAYVTQGVKPGDSAAVSTSFNVPAEAGR